MFFAIFRTKCLKNNISVEKNTEYGVGFDVKNTLLQYVEVVDVLLIIYVYTPKKEQGPLLRIGYTLTSKLKKLFMKS